METKINLTSSAHIQWWPPQRVAEVKAAEGSTENNQTRHDPANSLGERIVAAADRAWDDDEFAKAMKTELPQKKMAWMPSQ
jgi:hypothetical protein